MLVNYSSLPPGTSSIPTHIPFEKKFATLAARAVYASLFLLQKQLIMAKLNKKTTQTPTIRRGVWNSLHKFHLYLIHIIITFFYLLIISQILWSSNFKNLNLSKFVLSMHLTYNTLFLKLPYQLNKPPDCNVIFSSKSYIRIEPWSPKKDF